MKGYQNTFHKCSFSRNNFDIISNRLYDEHNYNSILIPKDTFKKLVLLPTQGIFMHNERFYKQVEGIIMGNPLGPTMANFFMVHLQRWSRGHKARGQGHKKNPRPRPRTAFPRTDTLEAKDRNARGQGQGPRTQSASALQKKKKKVFTKIFQAISKKKKKKKKKGLHKNFPSDLHEKTLSKK